MIGFCIKCKSYHLDEGNAFQQCPKGHELLHKTQCQLCKTALYFQCDDDYCGPESPVICGKCADALVKEKENE